MPWKFQFYWWTRRSLKSPWKFCDFIPFSPPWWWKPWHYLWKCQTSLMDMEWFYRFYPCFSNLYLNISLYYLSILILNISWKPFIFERQSKQIWLPEQFLHDHLIIIFSFILIYSSLTKTFSWDIYSFIQVHVINILPKPSEMLWPSHWRKHLKSPCPLIGLVLQWPKCCWKNLGDFESKKTCFMLGEIVYPKVLYWSEKTRV